MYAGKRQKLQERILHQKPPPHPHRRTIRSCRYTDDQTPGVQYDPRSGHCKPHGTVRGRAGFVSKNKREVATSFEYCPHFGVKTDYAHAIHPFPGHLRGDCGRSIPKGVRGAIQYEPE